MTLSDVPQSPWWEAGRHADRRLFLLARNRIKKALREWFEGEGFCEIEAGQLQVSPGNETHLHGLATTRLSPDGTPTPLYLHTSPEFACKKLLAAGEEKIFDFARVFRNREAGPLHATEFTMLEWYRAGADWQVVIEDCLALLRVAAEAVPTDQFRWRGQNVPVAAEPIGLSLAEAFDRYAQIDLMASLGPSGREDVGQLRAQAKESGVSTDDSDTWSDVFSKVLVQKIEPFLGFDAPCVLHSYPISEAALARKNPVDPRVAERFELYVCGVELANGFGELTDAVEQRARFEADMDAKQALYGERYPLDEDFLAALTKMPKASGVALGFDRLAVLASGARRIDDVLWTGVV
ncbi:EF-P lysine aminoacylase EpmA [Aquidulcibacter sp.]|uniref:EF-P lysine aminoacylase EpmA n=1 Tax=Aquidulcibacter sp. TaxID=2052990 RepID=UPI0025C29F62|nr:EF-P lysine aminoacylase EpmA [Aquidulcibacter sp.]MCA3695124.1 EF-P lysine aminoacylase GenX [Aquidulcibacter sp.]